MPDMDMTAALDPFVAAALRQRRGVMPEGGRQEGPATHVLESYLPHVAGNLAKTVMAPGEVMKGGDPTKGLSDESIEGMVPQALALSSLGPAASAPMAMAGSLSTDPMLAALYLQRRKMSDNVFGESRYNLRNENAEKVGRMNSTYDPRMKDIYVEGIYSNKPSPFKGDPTKEAALDANGASFSFGPRDIRSWLMGLRLEHPEAQTISGHRVSGARVMGKSENDIINPDAPYGLRTRNHDTTVKLPQFTPEQLAAYQAKAPTPEKLAAAQYREGMLREAEQAAYAEQQRQWQAAQALPRNMHRDPAYVQEEELMRALRQDREQRDAERRLQTRFGQAEGQWTR